MPAGPVALRPLCSPCGSRGTASSREGVSAQLLAAQALWLRGRAAFLLWAFMVFQDVIRHQRILSGYSFCFQRASENASDKMLHLSTI